ncbi:ThiF family adenylyltransferase [Azorhizobium sp. AG788]|uniref:ThiF family adenylyltransferase n=1 Tax=Azorhizobium sp. AG788 TaxID=2183897 RepID=UPI00313954BF
MSAWRSPQHVEAIAAVERWLSERVPGYESLDVFELAAARRGAVRGFRCVAQFADEPRRIHLLFSGAFPFEPAWLVLVDRPPFGTWPHVETDGRLCLVDERATFDPGDPVGGVEYLFQEAFQLVRRCVEGSCKRELQDEVLSYWDGMATGIGRPILSLVDPNSSESRAIRAWWGDCLLLADTEEAATAWLRNRYPGIRKGDLKTTPAALLWIGEPMVPGEFPRTAHDVLAMAEKVDATELLHAAAATDPQRVPVVLGMTTAHGPAFAGVIVERPSDARGRAIIRRGFRPGRVPANLAGCRFFGPDTVRKVTVDRVDPAWVHGREADPRFAKLRSSTVVVLGCGSVGAPIAAALANAGVGKLVLVDEQRLKAANLGRHPLGAGSVGLPKATELAARITKDLPHLRIEAIVDTVERLLDQRPHILLDADLIVSALGDWPAEALLDAWHDANGRAVPIVYGWTEPHACAGHAVGIVQNGARFRAGIDNYGRANLELTGWPGGPTVRREPACGAVFEPYGPVELEAIISMISGLVLDCILGQVGTSTHRMWAGQERMLTAAGGVWTDAWKVIAGSNTGSVVHERGWAEPVGQRAIAA